MKRVFLVVAILISIVLVAQYVSKESFPKQTVQTSNCPPEGDSPKEKFQELDKLKNRTEKKSYIDENIDVNSFLCSCPDQKKFSNTMYVTVTGYMVGLKYGGAETCECHSKEKTDEDFHIEIAVNAGETDKSKMVVCEMTRETRSILFADLKKYIGHKVKIEGYLFFDEEHWQNSVNTNPTGTDLWRATAWEVHPVFSVVVID